MHLRFSAVMYARAQGVMGVILRSRIEVSWLVMHGGVEGPRLCRVKRQTMNLWAPLKHHM